MALQWYLNWSNFSETVQLNTGLTAGTDWELEFQASNTTFGEFIVFGTVDNGNFNDFIVLRSANQIDVTINTTKYLFNVTDVTSPTAIYRIRRTPDGNLEVFQNNSSVGVQAVGASVFTSPFTQIGRTNGLSRGGRFDFLKFTNFDLPSVGRELRSTFQGGTGNIFTDLSGNGLTANLDNFPTDNSQWVSFSPPQGITSVDGDNIVTDGQQNVPVIVSGFAGDITSMSLRVGADTLALTGLTGTGDNYTIDLPDISAFVADTAGLPLSSATYQNEIVATNGTDTASINITRNPKTGYVVVETASAVSTEGSLFEGRTGGAPSDGSQIYYPTAGNTTISATGIIQTDATEFTAYVWDVTSKNWEVVTFNADSGGSSTYVKSIIRPIVKPIVKSILNN